MAAVTSKDNITTSTIDEGSLRGLGQLSLTAAPSETYRDEGHSAATLRSLFECFQNQELCDVALIAGARRISAHKVVLASCSKFFKAMLAGGLRESHLKEIPIGNVDPVALEDIVQYCYSGAIELRQETVENLLATARFLQFDRVASACSGYLQKHLDAGNCLRMALFAEHQFCKELHEEALKCAFKHLTQVVKQPEFLALQPDQLTSLLTSHHLEAVTVQSAFESLIAWVQHDSADREQHLAASLELLKLHLLPPQYLLNDVARACSHAPECLPLIMDALRRRLLAEPLAASAPRGASSAAVGRLCVIGGTNPENSTGSISIEVYSAESSAWCDAKCEPGDGAADRWWCAGAALRGRVLVVGGRDSQNRVVNTVQSFQLSNTTDGAGEWSSLAPMNAARCWPAAAALGDGPDAAVYVVGGEDGRDQCLRSVERWDARAAAWTLVAPMRVERRGCSVAALRGSLYAVGGWNGSALSSVECYDPSTNRWSDCAPMSCRRNYLSVCAAGGYLYAIGGWDGDSALASVERYDPVADTWVTVAPMSRARQGVASCLMGDRIVAVGGGEALNLDHHSAEVYDLASDSWQQLAPLHTGRLYTVLAHVPPC